MNVDRMLHGLDEFFNCVVEPIREEVKKQQETNMNLQIENGLLLADLERKQRVIDSHEDQTQELRHCKRLLDMYEARIHELDDKVDSLERTVKKQKKQLEALEEDRYERYCEDAIAEYEMDALVEEWHDSRMKEQEAAFDEQYFIEQTIELFEASSE